MEISYALSSEELGPREMVHWAQRAEASGFRSVWLSDHFHPWIDRQGQSPFVWSVIGGIAATTELRVATGVTCPLIRMHPAIVAHAAATAAVMLPGRFVLGVGTGEALNERVLGDRWPPADIRLEMLEEAITVIRRLWKGGLTSHEGKHYRVENARLYTRPEQPIPLMMSAFGEKAAVLAGQVADGYIGTSPDADVLRVFEQSGGAGKPKIGGLKVCWAADGASARRTAFELWPTRGLSGQLSQELALPSHFEQAVELVTEDNVVESLPFGPDPEPYLDALRAYRDIGYDEVSIHQIGPDQEGFFRFFEEEIRPKL